MIIKSIIGAVAICMSLLSTVAYSVPSYEYNTAGEIVGVTGLEFLGTQWDMTLHDGTFDALNAHHATSTVYSNKFAIAASRALSSFFNNQDIPLRDRNIEPFFGCPNTYRCFICTAISYSSYPPLVTVRPVRVWLNAANIFPKKTESSDASINDVTYATWVEVPASVPYESNQNK